MRQPAGLRVGIREYLCLAAAALCAILPAASAQTQKDTPVASARYTVEGADRLATVEAAFQLKVLTEGAQRIPLLPSSVPLETFKVAGSGARLEKGAECYVLCVPGRGDYRVSLKFVLAVTGRGQESSFTLPLAPAAAASVTLEVAKGNQTVVCEPQVPLKVTADARLTRAELYPAEVEAVTVSWLPADLKRELAPLYEVDAADSVSLTPGAAKRSTKLTLEMRRGAIDSASIAVPAGVDVLDLRAPEVGVEAWRVEKDGQRQVIRVRLKAPVKEKAVIELSSEQLAEASSGVFSVAPFTVDDASRHKGHIWLAAARRYTVVDAGSTAVRLPVEEESTKAKVDAATPIAQLAFQYHALPAEVRVRLTELPPQVTAAVETYVRLQAGLVESLSKLSYRIENAGMRDLRIGLDEGLIVLEVAGRDLETWDVKERVLAVRLKRPVLGAYELRLRCVQHLRKIDGVLIPQVRCQDADRESGCVGVSAGEDVGLTHYHATRFIQVEPQKLPEWLRRLSPKLAYTYDQPGGVLAVSTTLIQPAVEVEGCAVAKVAEDMVEEEYVLLARIKKQPVFSFLLRLPDGLTPINLVGDEVVDWEFLQSQGIINVSLRSGCVGETRLHLFCERRLTEKRDQIPLGGVAVLGTEHTTGWLGVMTNANLALVPPEQTPKGVTPADVKDAPSLLKAYGTLLLAYRWTGEEWGIACRAQPVAPSIRAATRTALLFGLGRVRVQTDISLNIEKARVGELLIDLPKDAVSARVVGKDILDRERTESGLRVRLADPIKGSYDLQVVYEQLPDARTHAFAYTGIVLPQADRQTGVIGVYLEDPKLEVTAGEMKNVVRSSAALPQIADGAPFLGGFEYGQAAHGITFAVKGLAMAGEVQLQAQACGISTVVKRDGQAVTYMNCRVTNDGAQFFRLRLPAKATLWGAYVSGEPVRPNKVKDEILLPVLDAPRGEPFEVGVIWSQPTDRLGLGSSLALAAPELGLPSQQVNWDVYLPQEYEVASSGGNMKMLRRDVWYRQGLPGVAVGTAREAWPYVAKGIAGLAVLALALLGCIFAYIAVRAVILALRGKRLRVSWVGVAAVVAVALIIVIAGTTSLGGRTRGAMHAVSRFSHPTMQLEETTEEALEIVPEAPEEALRAGHGVMMPGAQPQPAAPSTQVLGVEAPAQPEVGGRTGKSKEEIEKQRKYAEVLKVYANRQRVSSEGDRRESMAFADQAAEELYTLRNPARAEELARKALALDPRNEKAQKTYVEALAQQGKSVEMSPVQISTLSALPQAGLEAQKMEMPEDLTNKEAIAATEGEKKETAQRDRYGRALQLGDAYRKRGQLDEAAKNYQYALHERPDSAEAQQGLKQVEELKKTAPQAKPAKPPLTAKTQSGKFEEEFVGLFDEEADGEAVEFRITKADADKLKELPEGPCGSKPPAKDQTRNAGEGTPPLPLPGTPLRRSEDERVAAPAGGPVGGGTGQETPVVGGIAGEGRKGKAGAPKGGAPESPSGATGGGKRAGAGQEGKPGEVGAGAETGEKSPEIIFASKPRPKPTERYSAAAIMSYADRLQRDAGKDWDRDIAQAPLERQVLEVVTGKQKAAALDNNGTLRLEAGDLVIVGTPEQTREVKEAAARLRDQMSGQVKALTAEKGRRQDALAAQFREEQRRREAAEQVKAVQKVSSGTVTGSRGAGAKPLAIAFPASGTRAYPFHMDYAGTTQPTVELVCLRSGTAIVLQAAAGLLALLVIGFISYRKVSIGLPVAILTALALIFALTTSGEAPKPYIVSALAGVALAAPVIIVRLTKRLFTTETQRSQRTAKVG